MKRLLLLNEQYMKPNKFHNDAQSGFKKTLKWVRN